MEPTGMSRREFLVASSALSLLALIDSCTFGQASKVGATIPIPPGGSLYEKALKLLHQAIVASPDHLAQRAEELVAAKDAAKIVEFVRDRITVVPVIEGYGDPSHSRRWGTAATLRGGRGTFRERADVLADLLTRAGFKAEVQVGDRPPSLTVQSVYAARAIPAFAPDTARVELARSLLRQAGLPAAAPQQALPTGPDQAAAILQGLPAAAESAHTRNDLLPPTVPAVVYEANGKQQYALALGDIGVVDSPLAHLAPQDEDDVPNVKITVSATPSPALGAVTPQTQPIDLVSATWPADEVFGHDVLLTFVPPQGAKAVLDSGLASLPLRVPVLRVQNAAVTAEQAAKLAVAGQLITVHGDVLGSSAATADPTASDTPGPYGSFKLLSGGDRAAAVSSVKAITAIVSAASFRDIYLECSLTDASGAPVDGLDATSFTLKEEGAAVGSFVLYSNAGGQPRARVLVSYEGLPDPTPFKDDAAKQAFATSLASAIAQQATKTPFDVQVVRPGQAPSPSGWAAPDTAALLSAFTGVGDSDDPWLTFGGPALDQRISAVIAVGDADVTDTSAAHTLYYQRRLAAANVPVFFMPVGNVKTANLQLLLAASGGQQLDIGDPASPAKAAALAGAAASKWVGGAYRFRYQAPVGGPAQRTVTVGLAGRDQPAGTATYQVPAEPVPPPSFAGLSVRVEYPGVSVERRLAGVQLGSDPIESQSVYPTAIAETRAALDGITTLAFEPGTPTAAALLDDLVASYLSVAPLVPMWPNATSEAVLQAVSGGVKRTPVFLPSLLRPTTIDPGSTPGMRVAIIQERSLDGTNVEVHCDLAVGLNELIPLASDPHALFTAGVRTSVAWSAAEAATLSDSAYTRLAGVSLVPIANSEFSSLGSWLKTVPADRLAVWTEILRVYSDHHVVLPANGSADALWVVDRQTGAAKAVLLDSTGGGAFRGRLATGSCHLDGFDGLGLAISALSLFCSATPEFPFFCLGVNVAVTGMCVLAIFNGHADVGTPFGAIQPWIGLGEAGFRGLDFGLGVTLMVITLSSAGCL